MYNALSRVVCGSEQLSTIFRLLTAYVKYRTSSFNPYNNMLSLQTDNTAAGKSALYTSGNELTASTMASRVSCIPDQ